jgi:hypothetical protein
VSSKILGSPPPPASHPMKQLSFAQAEFAGKKKFIRRKRFLAATE